MTVKNDLYRKNMQEKENLIKDLLAQHVYFMKSVTKPTTVEELEKEFLSRAKNSQNNNFYVTEVPEKWAKEMFSAFNDHYLQYDFEPLLLVGNQVIGIYLFIYLLIYYEHMEAMKLKNTPVVHGVMGCGQKSFKLV